MPSIGIGQPGEFAENARPQSVQRPSKFLQLTGHAYSVPTDCEDEFGIATSGWRLSGALTEGPSLVLRLVRVVGLSAWQYDPLEDKGGQVVVSRGEFQRCGGCVAQREWTP